MPGSPALKRTCRLGALVLLALGLSAGAPHVSLAQGASMTFDETGKTVEGPFLEFYAKHGGSQQTGLPISDRLQEKSDTDGKTYTVQYFERAVFELHPENAEPYNVLLSHLGVFRFRARHAEGTPAGELANRAAGSMLFTDTGKSVGCEFLDFWNRNGGLDTFGYPISDEITEVSEMDGKPHLTQYFERAVFEYHPEGVPGKTTVQVLPLGLMRLNDRNPASVPAVSQRLLPQSAKAQSACTPTRPDATTAPMPAAPVRQSVGKGHILEGTVKSSVDCSPVKGTLVFWLAGPTGVYDDDHAATVPADSNGNYTFESNFPGQYAPYTPPHIHYYVSADGYDPISAELFLPCSETEGVFDFVLVPRP